LILFSELSGKAREKCGVFLFEYSYRNNYTKAMVTAKNQAVEIATQLRRELEKIYSSRLKGVYLFGSAARDQLTPDSDIDIAIILDEILSRFEEHERTSEVSTKLSLKHDRLISFFFVNEKDFKNGRFAVHRAIKREGIPS
jgi:predicted nucleotidyltransferase